MVVVVGLGFWLPGYLSERGRVNRRLRWTGHVIKADQAPGRDMVRVYLTT